MKPLDQLNMTIGAELEAAGGILDCLDYNRLRRLGVQLRNIPKPSDDLDLPPASLQGWIASYEASIESLRIVSESGLLRLLQSHSDDIRAALSLEIIPAIDQEIVDLETIDELITMAKDQNRLKHLDFEKLQESLPSNAKLAQNLVVPLGLCIRYDERWKVDESTGLKRLKLGTLIGKVALGGALAVANLSFGAVGGIASIPGIIASTYTGVDGMLSAIDKLTDALKK